MFAKAVDELLPKKEAKQLYGHFEELAENIGITIIDGKGDFSGGYCTVIDDQFIVLNKLIPYGSESDSLDT